MQSLSGRASRFGICLVGLILLCGLAHGETLAELGARLGRETQEAYAKSPFTAISSNYFNRFARDPEAKANVNEITLDGEWAIVNEAKDIQFADVMAGHLIEFLGDRMGVQIANGGAGARKIVLSDRGAPDMKPESFTIAVAADRIAVTGADAEGMRDGVVKLVSRIGMRQAPIIEKGTQTYSPRLRVRLGTTPYGGSTRDLIFMGYNAVFAGGGELYGISQSDAIPELAARRVAGALEGTAKAVADAKQNKLKAYAFVSLRSKFPENDPIFQRDPSIRGTRTWKADGEFVLCTEHPAVRQFLSESMKGMFDAAPTLDGVVLIIGGEGFYHCFMRPFGVEKGHTNCTRCEALGADTVVANLCNLLADAARSVNPKAEVIAWPYSAEHVWSLDKAQSGFIAKLKPGTGIFTEMEKDEYVSKPDGVNKHLWDYSIDMIGPGERAKEQIAACRKAGISIYMKSEPELAFEAPRLSHVPCMDRWIDRAEALASCGADGAWVFPAFRPCYGTPPAEANQLVWWDPAPSKDDALNALANRIAGPKAGPKLREAWRHVSDAIPFSPEIPPYYTGPYYLGPAHPMCADKNAKVPEVFYGQYLFMAEMSDSEGLPARPTYFDSPRGNVPVFLRMYREMEAHLKLAADAVDAALPDVPERCRLVFDSESSAIRWFYRTARAHANFYESCQLRDALAALAGKPDKTPEELIVAREHYERWLRVLMDEKENAKAALPIMEADVRLDWYYGSDHTFPHGADMIREKLRILDVELAEVLPGVARKVGLDGI
ncbi:MAG TPA: hypothetical protein PLJ47_13390 [Candidatus Hydrogenedentes bacterium]|nr:hypothetical protein [Candidatus Hydrogenedentota bacterium]